MNQIIHGISKIKEVGFRNFFVGTIKREKYKKLQKEYGFDPWHISPYELRKYAQVTAEYINEHLSEGAVIDIGCGLGEILRRIHCPKRIGYEVADDVLKAAKLLCKEEDIEFRYGSFAEFDYTGTVDYLITLGFMHGSDETTWTGCYHRLAEQFDIKHFVVDVLPQNGPSHCLDFTVILPENYKCIQKIGPFLGGRFLEIYERM